MRLLPKKDKNFKTGQATSSAILSVVIATVVVVFCLFSAKALLAQGAYQRRVVNAKHATVNQLKSNISAANTLTSQYESFNSSNPNVIGGKSDVLDDAPPPDGKNSRIVLDALPAKYDFPALISSLSKLLDMDGMSNKNIGGSDQSASFASTPSTNPQPVTISQIPLGGTNTYAGVQTLVKDLERSIRPYDIISLQFSGGDSNMTITLNMNTYYQPAKIINLESKEVK